MTDQQGTFPTFLSFFPLIRKVLIREQIDIVHGHQATSNLAHELPGRSQGRVMVCRCLDVDIQSDDLVLARVFLSCAVSDVVALRMPLDTEQACS